MCLRPTSARSWAWPAGAALLVLGGVALGRGGGGVTGTSAIWGTVSSDGRVEVASASVPRYALVHGSIETIWQRPPRDLAIKGIWFLAHGCQHQGTDFFTVEGVRDQYTLEECASSGLGTCLGLPEEVRLKEGLRRRGYIVVAVSGGKGVQSCWYDTDVEKVARAVDHVRKVENIGDANLPVFAFGASSGGSFVGELEGKLHGLKCITPMISDVRDPDPVRTPLPALFLHMPRDKRTAAAVSRNIAARRKRGGVAAEFPVKMQPLTPTFFSSRTVGTSVQVSEEVSRSIVQGLRGANELDAEGYLVSDPRRSHWRDTVEAVLAQHGVAPGFDGGLRADMSAISELMNVAYAKHELVEFSTQLADFCENPSQE